jgi:hypothetical protein
VKPRRTPSSNTVFRLPGGTEDDDLWTCVTHDALDPSQTVICSVWELSDEERQAIADGANVELAMYSGVQPPMVLQTTTEPLGRHHKVSLAEKLAVVLQDEHALRSVYRGYLKTMAAAEQPLTFEEFHLAVSVYAGQAEFDENDPQAVALIEKLQRWWTDDEEGSGS